MSPIPNRSSMMAVQGDRKDSDTLARKLRRRARLSFNRGQLPIFLRGDPHARNQRQRFLGCFQIVAVSLLVGLCLVVAMETHRWRRDRRNINENLPDCRRILVYQAFKRNGFGSQVLRMVEAFAVARNLSAVWLFYPEKYWNYGCGRFRGWDCYFSLPMDLCIDHLWGTVRSVSDISEELRESDGSPDILRQVCRSFRAVELQERTYASSQNQICQMIGDVEAEEAVHQRFLDLLDKNSSPQVLLERTRLVTRAMFQPIPTIRQGFNEVMDRVGLNGQAYIGVHLRRGDKHTEATSVEVAVYAHAIRSAAPHLKLVFVASDDYAAVLELGEHLGSDYTLQVMPSTRQRSGHLQSRSNSRDASTRAGETVELIIEILVLAHADFFVGTFSSNLGRLVHTLRDVSSPANQSISVDDRWQPGVAWRTFRTDYCQDSLSNRDFCDTRSLVRS